MIGIFIALRTIGSIEKAALPLTKLSVDQALIKARSHTKKGEVVEAQRLLEAVLRSYPKNKRAKKGLAKLNYSKLDNAARSSLEETPPQQVINLLLNLYNKGEFSAVLQETKALTSKYPAVFLIWNLMGVAAAQLGLLHKAKIAFQKAIDLNPKSAETYNNMGNILIDEGQLEDAIVAYEKAISIKPGYAEAWYNMGNVFQDQGKLDQAIEAYEKAISLSPNHSDAFYNMGNVLQDQGKLDLAIGAYKKAISFNPEFLCALNNMANAFKEQGRLEQALDTYNKILEINPEHIEAHYNIGNTLKDQCKLDEAIEAFNSVLSLQPDHVNARHMVSSLTGHTTEIAPREYVENLFDGYADKFEESLVRNLAYNAPNLIADLLKKFDSEYRLGSVLDLGCGTGLLGSEIKNYCSNLVGIDLSDKMLKIAEQKTVYNKLHKADIVDYLSDVQLSFDYFIAADVFVYIGDLSEIFRLIKSRNKKSAKLVFSTEHTERNGYYLRKTGRYSHSKSYIEGLCKKFGYEVSHFSTFNLRKENGPFIQGGLYILQSHSSDFKTNEFSQIGNFKDLSLDQLLHKGIASHKAGNAQAAYQYYSAVLNADYRHPEANYSMGLLAAKLGKLKKALLFFRTALEERPNFEQFWIRYIDTLIALGKIAEAKSMLTQCEVNIGKNDILSHLSSKVSNVLNESITKFYKDLSTEIVGVAALGWLYDITIDREFFRPVIGFTQVNNPNQKVIDTTQNQTYESHFPFALDKIVDELNSIKNTKDRFQKLKSINSPNNKILFCDNFSEITNMDFEKAQKTVFKNESLNILILGAGPCGLFLANALKKKLAKDVNVLVLDTNCQQENFRKSFSRSWLSHLPMELFEQYFNKNMKQLAGSFGRNGYIGLPINLIELLLFLSAKQNGVNFYFSGSPDYSFLNDKLIDLAFDASGGRILYKNQRPNRKSKISNNLQSKFLNFDFAGVKQFKSDSFASDGTIPITLKEAGHFYYPHLCESQLCLNSIKLTQIPASIHSSLLNYIKRNNKSNRFYLWSGDLSDDLNELLVMANLFQEEYEYLCKSVISKEKLNGDFVLKAKKSQKIRVDLLDFLNFLISTGYSSQIYMNKPFVHKPRINLFPLEQELGGVRVYPVGDSLFSGNPKVGNGLGTHIRYISELVETVF